MSFKNHPSMKQRPISTRPILQDSTMSPQIHSNRPNTALGHSGEYFLCILYYIIYITYDMLHIVQ